MERLKEVVNNNKPMVLGTLTLGALIAGYYGIKKYNSTLSEQKGDIKWHFDPSFATPNIPLYHSQA